MASHWVLKWESQIKEAASIVWPNRKYSVGCCDFYFIHNSCSLFTLDIFQLPVHFYKKDNQMQRYSNVVLSRVILLVFPVKH